MPKWPSRCSGALSEDDAVNRNYETLQPAWGGGSSKGAVKMAQQNETLKEARRVLDTITRDGGEIEKETRERLQRYLRTVRTGNEARECLKNR